MNSEETYPRAESYPRDPPPLKEAYRRESYRETEPPLLPWRAYPGGYPGSGYDESSYWRRKETESWREPAPWSGSHGPRPACRKGEHYGKAPRGYTRSDGRIREEICDRLMHGEVDPSRVEVKVENGEVTLEGFIDSREAKHRVEEIAEETLGVKDINNGLRVRRAESGDDRESADEAMRSSTKSAKRSAGDASSYISGSSVLAGSPSQRREPLR